MMYQIWILAITVLHNQVFSQQLPDYIKPCYLKEPDFNDCALKHANLAIPTLVKGDKSLNIPKLDPLKLPSIDINQNNFRLTLKDVDVLGLQHAQVTSINLSKTGIELVLHIDLINVIGKYQMDGNVLLLALKGEGRSNITAVGGDFTVKGRLESYEKKGETYLKLVNPTFGFEVKRAYFDFENLLNDEKLGSEINALLNENWSDVLNDLGTPIKETVSTIIETIVSNILDKVTEKNIFPE